MWSKLDWVFAELPEALPLTRWILDDNWTLAEIDVMTDYVEKVEAVKRICVVLDCTLLRRKRKMKVWCWMEE